jgi:hypothetical protein
MADETRPRVELRIWVALIACAVIVLCETLPWVVAGAGGEGSSYSGLDVWPLAAAELLAIAATAGLTVAALLTRRPQLTEAAAVAAIVAVVFTGTAIVALETAAAAIPDSALPATVRRNSLDLGAGIGLWVACGAGLIAVLALADRGFRTLELRARIGTDNRQWALALATLLVLTVLFGWVRYEVWFDASAASEHLGLAGWASPWIGPLSLFAVWLLVAALALGLTSRTQAAGLFAAAGGWLASFAAALAIVAASTIGNLADLADGMLDGGEPDFQVTVAAWSAFLVGLAAAAVGGWLVSLRPPSQAD